MAGPMGKVMARSFGVAVCAGTWLVSTPTPAAELHLRAPDDCADASSVEGQVEGLLGHPLAQVMGVDFEVEISQRPDRRWKLRLDTVDKAGKSQRTRELVAASCRELADAAAVAITLSIRSTAAGRDTTLAASSSSSSLDPPGATDGDGSPPGTLRTSPPPPAASSSRKGLALSAVVDAGAMPGLAAGLGLEASLRFPNLRFVGLGALFLSRETRLAGRVGGEFQLAVAGVLTCLTETFGRMTLLGCGGGEAGRLSGEGVGVSTSRERGALWLAARGELGGGMALGPRLTLVLRAGVVLPLSRPTFFLDGTTAVHRPGRATSRTTVGIELAF